MKRIMEWKPYKLWLRFAIKLDQYHISAYASSAAFFTFLSLIPMMMVFFAILPYTPITEATILTLVSDVLPRELLPLAIGMLDEFYHKKVALLSISILIALWSSAKGTLALTRGLNVINEVSEKRNYFLLRFRACVYTVIMLAMLIVLLVLVIFGESIVKATTQTYPNLHLFFDFILSIRVVFLIGVLALFFWAVFTWLPSDVKTETREDGATKDAKVHRNLAYEFPGAIFTACIWYFASWLFSEYVNRFPAFSTYGSMATIIIIMFWLYMCFYIILLGAMINNLFRQLAKVRSRRDHVRRE